MMAVDRYAVIHRLQKEKLKRRASHYHSELQDSYSHLFSFASRCVGLDNWIKLALVYSFVIDNKSHVKTKTNNVSVFNTF